MYVKPTKTTVKKPLGDLSPGEPFTVDHEVYIRTRQQSNYTAVRLSDGKLFSWKKSTRVTPSDAIIDPEGKKESIPTVAPGTLHQAV